MRLLFLLAKITELLIIVTELLIIVTELLIIVTQCRIKTAEKWRGYKVFSIFQKLPYIYIIIKLYKGVIFTPLLA